MFKTNDTMVYVYAVPERGRLSNGFCFGGGNPTTFLNVDWFNGFDGMTEKDVREHVASKQYAKKWRELLILSPENDLSVFVRTE